MACLASEEQMPIYDEIWNMSDKIAVPGGSAMNSARSTNYMLKNQGIENRITYFGAVGNDDRGSVIEMDLKNDGINGNLHRVDDVPTGTCAVVVVDKDRSLCANLAAACKYS